MRALFFSPFTYTTCINCTSSRDGGTDIIRAKVDGEIGLRVRFSERIVVLIVSACTIKNIHARRPRDTRCSAHAKKERFHFVGLSSTAHLYARFDTRPKRRKYHRTNDTERRFYSVRKCLFAIKARNRWAHFDEAILCQATKELFLCKLSASKSRGGHLLNSL